MIRKIKIKGKTLRVKECRSIFSKARGLMFRKKSKPLLFIFKKPTRQSIHSFFCPIFKAIWMKNGNIIEERIVRPFSLSVRPKKPFTHLVEMPLGDNNKN